MNRKGFFATLFFSPFLAKAVAKPVTTAMKVYQGRFCFLKDGVPGTSFHINYSEEQFNSIRESVEQSKLGYSFEGAIVEYAETSRTSAYMVGRSVESGKVI